jgi:hypothetical protein
VVDYLSHIWDFLALCKLDESLNACTLDLNVRGVFEASARCFSIDVDVEAEIDASASAREIPMKPPSPRPRTLISIGGTFGHT